MHDKLGVPYAFTWEIFGDLAADYNDCFRMFNPLSAAQLQQVLLPRLHFHLRILRNVCLPAHMFIVSRLSAIYVPSCRFEFRKTAGHRHGCWQEPHFSVLSYLNFFAYSCKV